MIKRLSIAFPIIGVMIFLVISVTLSFYFVEVKALQDALLHKENSKAEDIYYIVESLLERESNKLSTLSTTLKRHQDLLQGLSHFIESDGDITPLKKAMDSVFLQLDIDYFQITDLRKQIIYRTHAPQEPNETVDIPELENVYMGNDVLIATRTEKQWALLSIVPAEISNTTVGAIMVGTWLNDDYARKIAFETEGHVSFGSLDGVIASSLPFDQRNDINLEALRSCITDIKSIRAEYLQEHKVINYSPMELAGKLFSVMVEIDTQSSYEMVQAYKRHILKFALLTLAIAFSLGGLFTIYLVKPLKVLQRKAKETVRNISGMDLKENKGNEIQNMIRLFDSMVATATAHIAERMEAENALKKQQEQLEEQITARTAELRTTNQKLRLTVGELEKRTSETLLLNQIGDLLQACDSEEETYGLVARFCRRLFPEDAGYLSVFDKGRKMLRTVSTWGDISGEEFGPNDCWALRLGNAHVVQHPDVDPVCTHLHDYQNQVYLCAPMIAQGELLGMIHMRLGGLDALPNDKTIEDVCQAKQLLVTSILEHYAPPMTNLRLRETLKIQSIHDPLTGLYNRRHMEETLRSEARRAERHKTSLGIIMADVDHFKVLNDTFSHEAGDIVLTELAKFLKSCIRKEDIACRYGGEEFILILPETNLEQACMRAEDLREKIQNHLSVSHRGHTHTLTISLGVAAYPMHGPTTDDTLKAADQALYLAKTRGRNQVAKAPE